MCRNLAPTLFLFSCKLVTLPTELHASYYSGQNVFFPYPVQVLGLKVITP